MSVEEGLSISWDGVLDIGQQIKEELKEQGGVYRWISVAGYNDGFSSCRKINDLKSGKEYKIITRIYATLIYQLVQHVNFI